MLNRRVSRSFNHRLEVALAFLDIDDQTIPPTFDVAFTARGRVLATSVLEMADALPTLGTLVLRTQVVELFHSPGAGIPMWPTLRAPDRWPFRSS